MARILIQTNDARTVLDERHITVGDADEDRRRSALLERVGRALAEADRPRSGGSRRRPRRIAAIMPATDYRQLFG